MTVPADKEETHTDTQTHNTLRSLILSDYIAKQSTSAEKIFFFLKAAFICEKPILLHISETRTPPSGHFQNKKKFCYISVTCANWSFFLTGHCLDCCATTQSHLHRQQLLRDCWLRAVNGREESSFHSLQDREVTEQLFQAKE